MLLQLNSFSTPAPTISGASSQLAFGAISLVSRANCNVTPFPGITGLNFNESISYNKFDGNDYWFQTASVHNLGGYAVQDGSNWNNMHHDAKTWEHTWRQWTGDLWHSWPLPTWYVHGVHYYVNPGNGLTYLTYTFATTCNITEW
ncbi:MAG TPA: hypothetical protein PKE27_09575, partial [Povalibacter sp.]|uniref:hypothetical protein n=1 Tax=Povalibacter sp. TaxID=1962978 RepID=UPI002BDDE045